ncbi:MAG: 4-(cytidine 5'-diphospho)-2-C-methyl-D-erythritol kinase [Lachnospiraceae bacterium]|nr:4-(cytidine 5'-diphospho)-2-C-methyl-D-erythritol kinase [Lachnospiraceae bacterium]
MQITRKAYGKINIGLDVTGKREDGYHLVKMILQTVDIHDDVTVSRMDAVDDSAAGKHKPLIRLTCDDPTLPTDERNLAYRAAAAMIEAFHLKDGVSIDITKRIPKEAGMAGGSTDAAAVILAMQELFDLNAATEELDAIALRLGADVPFCLRKGTWLAEGIGEKLTQLKDLPHAHLVIIVPDFGISTKWAYEQVDAIPDLIHPDIDAIAQAIEAGDLAKTAKSMGNILEEVAIRNYPKIREIKESFLAHGAMGAMMSGSGSAVFGIFDDPIKAEQSFEAFEGDGYGKFKSQL